MERICVAIRVKPPSKQDTTSNGIAQWKVVENAISLYNALGTPIKGQTYSFDTIFGTSATNADIYNEHAKDLVRSAVSGFNGTVFAYGQTSSGKTYTMQGSGSDPGVTRLAIRDVFTNIEKIEDREFLIRVSYMEIYNEEINDLLAPENRKLQIHESIERGIFVAGLREEIVQSLEQVLAVLERGEAQRHFGETNMNVNSSRSHTIFRMVIESRDKSHDSRQDIDPSAQDAVRVSALNMVDLAGSERISKTGAGGVRLKEGAHINKSLTTLGIVINKLSEGGGKQGAHIPYRDSKLTRILQSALGGNAKTAVICTINPDEIHIDETRGTLQFASRAKRVTNCAQVNEILTDAALLKRQKREIEDLRRRLQGSPHSEDLETEILRLRNDLLKFELERERLELELQEEKKAQVERERRIKEQEQRIENLSTLVISGAMEDRELPNKKGNRRETWCPRVFNSDIADQGFRRLIPGNKDFSVSASFDASSRPVASRRDRAFGLPPAFESLVDDESDSFWSNSSGADVQPTLSNFENVADEDTWMSLNRGTPDFANVADEDTWANLNEGHVNMDTRFSYSVSDIGTREGPRLAQPLVDESPNKLVLLEQQLKDMKLQYEELQSSMEAKIQEGLKDALTESTKSRQQLDALHNENLRLQKSLAEQENLSISNSIGDATYMKELEAQVKELENQLKNCKQENIDLRTENVKLHDQVLQTQTALEQGVQERVSMDEENKFFRERLRSLEMGIQDDCHQQSDGAFDCEDDLAHESPTVISHSNMCVVCQSTTDKNTEGYSTQVEALGSKDLAVNFETLVSKVNKRRLFDSIEDGLGQALGEYELEKPQSCDEVSVEVDYDLQKKIMGREVGIITALSCLCCRIKQLVDPVASEVEFERKEPRVAQAGTSLKVALNRARNLASQLLKDLHVIVNHDTQCLESHLMSKGTVATNLEALQLVLLQTADVALCLFHKLCSTEPQMIYKKLQQFVHEVLGDGTKSTVIESHAHTLNKGGKMTHPVDTTKVEMDVEENTGTDLLPELSKVTGEADSGIANVEIQLRSVEAEVATEEESEFIERLKMSGQHISTLDSELAVQSLVQKKISKALIEQLNMNHESMKAMKAEKLRLARDLENYMGALAMHDEVVAAICAEIKEFEKDVGMKRHDPSQTGRVMEPGQYFQKQSNYEVVKVDSETLFMDDDRETLQQILEHSRKSLPDDFDSRHNLSTEILAVFVKKNLLLQKSLIHAQSKLKVAEEEITQLRQNIEDNLSMAPPLDSTEYLDPCRYSGLYYFNPEEERKSASEDAEEDLCNLDLQTGIEQEPGGRSNGHSDMCSDLQVADYSKDSVNNMEALQNAQGDSDISVEEQRLMANMSEAEKQFTMELLRKVKALQVRLTVAEMELVEYKVEMEHFKANNLRVSIEAPLDSGDWELQALRAECEVHKEEIRQLLEQVMTPEAEVEREALFQDTIERNNRLERYLKKTERRLLRAKGWREELLKLRETEKLKEKLLHDTQARNVKLKEERMLLRQALSKAQQPQSANLHGSDEIQNMELQLTSAVRSRRQDGVMPSPTAIGSNLQSTLTPCNHARGFHLRPARPVLGDVNKNNVNLLQSSLRKNVKEVHCHHDDVKKRPLDVWSNKENQSCSMDPFASTN